MIWSFFSYPSKLVRYLDRLNLDIKMVNKLVKDKQMYLKPGKYNFTNINGKKIIYLDDSIAKEFVENLANSQRQRGFYVYLRSISNKFVNFTIKGNHYTEKFQGTLVMITRNYDIRIFDFSKGENYVFLSNKTKFLSQFDNYIFFSQYFLIPKATFNIDHFSYTEEYLDFKPYHLWDKTDKEKILQVIFSNYKSYYKSLNKKKIASSTTNEIFYNFQKKVKHESLVCLVNEVLASCQSHENHWPIIRQHGDLGPHNILLHENNFFFIDWEDSNAFVFFYDIFNCFYTSLETTKFFDGFFDEELRELFSFFGLSYNYENRLLYFVIFMMQRSVWEVQVNKSPDLILDRACIIIKSNM